MAWRIVWRNRHCGGVAWHQPGVAKRNQYQIIHARKRDGVKQARTKRICCNRQWRGGGIRG